MLGTTWEKSIGIRIIMCKKKYRGSEIQVGKKSWVRYLRGQNYRSLADIFLNYNMRRCNQLMNSLRIRCMVRRRERVVVVCPM